MGVHSGRTKMYLAAHECILHHIEVHGRGKDALGIGMVTEISNLNHNNGELLKFARKINLYGKGLLWVVHETDSFFYNNLNG